MLTTASLWAEHHRAAGLQLPSPPEDSRRIPRETSAKQFSLPPDGSAVCEGVPCCCRGILEHEHAGGHSKTLHGQTLGVTPKGDSPHLQLPCDSFICPSSKASTVMTRMLACTGPASILMSPCLHCTGLRCFPLQHVERGASVLNNKGCSTSKVSSPKQHHNRINHFCFP